jgi:hypothetical protein
VSPADEARATILKDESWADPGWTRIPNSILRDEELSWEAKGLLAYMASHATRFEVSVATLMRVGGSGRDRTRKILKELQDAGYLQRRQLRVEGGRRLGQVEYTLYSRRSGQATEKPFADDSLGTGSQAPGCQPPENTTPYKKNNSKKTIFEEEHSSGGAELALADTDGTLFLVRAEEVNIDARVVVAAWVDEVRKNGTEPSKAQVGRVAKTAKELLEKNQATRVLDAARHAGEHGHGSIDSALTILNGKPFESRRPEKKSSIVTSPTGTVFERG